MTKLGLDEQVDDYCQFADAMKDGEQDFRTAKEQARLGGDFSPSFETAYGDYRYAMTRAGDDETRGESAGRRRTEVKAAWLAAMKDHIEDLGGIDREKPGHSEIFQKLINLGRTLGMNVDEVSSAVGLPE